MKRVKIFKSLIVVAMLVVAFGMAHFIPASAQPGTAGDPLVPRSYVDRQVAELREEINELRAILSYMTPGIVPTDVLTDTSVFNVDREALFSEMIQYFEAVYGELLDAVAAIAINGGAGQVVPFTPLNIPAGQILIAEAGAEFILRSGLATAVSGPDGMVNVTTGRDIVDGYRIPTNNLLLVPRSDGRGFYADTDVWVMIKGGYQIVN
ncbi:MAG: hypothetical protein FWC32_10905 [Firmicutes bacterium]|nr:hypothetical protein [Bacillota bacterium]